MGDGERNKPDDEQLPLDPDDRPESAFDADATAELEDFTLPGEDVKGVAPPADDDVVWQELVPESDNQPAREAPASFKGPEPALSLVKPLEGAPIEEETDSETGDSLWHDGPSVLDEFTSGDYVSATTMEYQGLAEAVRKSEAETHELHAVAATIPGMDSGVVGFEDVTGEAAPEPGEAEPSDLPTRVITAVVLGGLFLGALFAGGAWLVLLIGLVAILSLGEFYAAARRVGYVPVAIFGLVGTIGTMVGAWFGGPGGIAGAIALVTMFVLLWYSVMVRKDPLENAAVTIFGLVWVGGLLAFGAPIARHPDYLPLLITLVLTAAFMDIGSYFIGRSVGRRVLAPVLSPKKTVEGLLGGVAVAFGVAALASLVFAEITFSGALWLALGVSIMAPLGDMAESMVKRSFGIKDMGSILPGHGGFLDRIDGLLFVIPISYFIYLALGYLG